MSRIPWRFYVLAGVLIVINVGAWLVVRHELLRRAPRSMVRFAAVLPPPEGEADDADRLAVTFADPVVDVEAVGQRLEKAPFALQPQPDGYWQWASTQRLEYVLSAHLPAGRVYRMKASSDGSALAGKQMVGWKDVEFRTRPLRLNSCVLAASDHTDATVEVRFNQPVDPGQFEGALKIDSGRDNATLTPTVLTRHPSDVMTVRVARPASNLLRVRVAAGLTGEGGQRGLEAPFRSEVPVASAFVLLRAQVNDPSVGQPIRVWLHFSKELDSAQTMPAVQLTPAVKDVQVSRQGSSLLLTGSFACGHRYSASVDANVLAGSGETLDGAQNVSFDIPEQRAGLRFMYPRGVLSPRGNLTLDMEVVNTSTIHLTAGRLYANNLASHLVGRATMADLSRLVLEKTVKVDLPRNVPQQVALDLKGLLAAPLGVYTIRAEATDSRWTSDTAVVTVTDLGLTAKRQKSGVLVWVTSLRSGEPVSGTRVTVISEKNQKLAEGVTGDDGVARLTIADHGRDGEPWIVTAEAGEDLSFLELTGRTWQLEDIDTSGRPYPAGYEVMLYTDRGVYRPGEMIHLSGIIRDGSGAVPAAFPLTINVHRPDGRFCGQIMVKPQGQTPGVFDAQYQTTEDAYVGAYSFRATLPGSEAAIGKTACLVEAFVPVRIELKAAPVQARCGPDEEPALKVNARYLFGEPAADLAVRVTGTAEPAAHQSARYPLFSFNSARTWRRLTLPEPEGTHTLDSQGQATVKLKLPPDLEPGLWKVGATAEVTETGGRTLSAYTTLLVDKVDRHVGLRFAQGDTVVVGQPAALQWVRVNGADESVPTDPTAVEFSLNRVEYDNVLEEVNHHPVWKCREHLIPIKNGIVDVRVPAAGDPGTMNVRCPEPGSYRLEAMDRSTHGTTRLSFYAWHAGQSQQTPDLSAPERLQIVLDQPSYVPGGSAKVAVRSPFAGTMLLTVEGEKVLLHRVVELTGNTVELELPIDASLRGGAFVTATVVRAVDPQRADWLPHRALGVTRLVIDHRAATLSVEIIAPGKAQPGTTVPVMVRTGSPRDPGHSTMVHLWAVDEGILLTTGYVTPKPAGFFFAPRQLAVSSMDLFADLLPDRRQAEGMLRIGGDGGEEEPDAGAGLSLRRSAVPNRQKAPAVVWSAWQPADPDGTLRVEMTLPKTCTQMRLMAVAADQDSYGSSQQALTLASPIMVEASWPRFAAPGDQFQVPVKVFNTTASAVTANLSIQAEGGLEIDAQALREPLVLKPNQATILWISVKASAIGSIHVVVRAIGAGSDGAGLVAQDETVLAVRPGALPVARSEVLSTKAGETLVIKPDPNFLPQALTLKISAGGRPGVQLRPAVEQLIDYPYGCVEQTTSRLYALLHAPALLAADAPPGAGGGGGAGGAGGAWRGAAVADMVNAGIARLWTMQTSSGGLSYWPGGQQPDLWGTCYAAGWLIQAKQSGYAIDPHFLDDLLKYLQHRLNDTSQDGQRELNANIRALMCHVLAAFGRPAQGWMSRLSETLDQLDLDGRAHLAGAFHEAGQDARALSILTDPVLGLTLPTSTGGRLVSQVGGEAMLLSVLLDIDKNHAWIPLLVRRLEAQRRNGQWGSTYGNASVLAALVKYQVSSAAKADFRATLSAGPAGQFVFDQAQPLSTQIADAGGPLEISSQGTGAIFVAVVREGLLKPELVKPLDQQLKVRRRWVDRQGSDVDLAQLHVGDLVRAEVTLATVGRAERIDNVVIVDCLPGGMEVENPRLGTSAQPGGPSASSNTAPSTQFLDDRVLIFSPADSGERKFFYDLRVVTAGQFDLPPIQASCMYDPTLASIHGGGRATVSKDVRPHTAATTRPATTAPASHPGTPPAIDPRKLLGRPVPAEGVVINQELDGAH